MVPQKQSVSPYAYLSTWRRTWNSIIIHFRNRFQTGIQVWYWRAHRSHHAHLIWQRHKWSSTCFRQSYVAPFQQLSLITWIGLYLIIYSYKHNKPKIYLFLPYPCRTWQHATTLRKLSTCGASGAAPDRMMRTLPPRLCLTCRKWNEGDNESGPHHTFALYVKEFDVSCDLSENKFVTQYWCLFMFTSALHVMQLTAYHPSLIDADNEDIYNFFCKKNKELFVVGRLTKSRRD